MVAQVSRKSALRVERIQASRQLNYLGFERGDKVPLRFFYHSDDPRKNGDKGRKLDRLKWEEVERFQSDGRGVYVVVNGKNGGHEDKDISQCIAIFCEWDDIPLEDQVFYWETVGFLEPTFTVYSGDKSMQPYWVFDEPLTNIDQWRELQQLLIEVMDADPANKNPSRVFRLAGGWHIKPGREPVQTKIAQDSGKKYSVEKLLMKLEQIKHQQQPGQQSLGFTRYENIQVPVPELVPLEVCLSKESRSLLTSGVSKGRRNTNGAKLARDLIGTADYLASIGQQFNGDARLLLENYASRCNPPLPVKEVDAIWKSAQKAHPDPSCPTDYIKNNVRAWYWREYVKSSERGYSGGICSGGSGGGNRRGNGSSGSSSGDGGDGGDGDGNNGKVVTHPNFIPVSGDELEVRIDQLIAQKITGSKLTSCLNRLAAESQWHVIELRKLYFERKDETEQTEEQVEAQSLLPSLLQVHRLDLREFLWGDEGLLAEAMIETAKAMPTSPEFLFTTLLPTAATLIGTSSRIVVKAKGKYKQPCIFLATVVGRSGQLKTPAQKVVIDPLVQLEIKANEQYQLDLENYEIGLANWKKDKDADSAAKPKPPTRKRYITKDATTESLERIHGQNPRGLLVHRDEIAEDFKADNAYRNGKGGDTEKKLDQFNGSPLITDRKEREVILERSAISRTGSIQWEVLQSLMGDGRDDNGAFARWLFCAAEAPPRFINLLEDDIDTGIEELLTHLYKRLEKMPDKDYLLSSEAKQLFQSWQHELVRAEINETHTGLQVVYPKIEAYTARFALWLHLVNSALAEVTAPAVIGAHIMSAAIKLAKYYLEQAKLVMATNSPESGLTGVLLKIQKYTQGKPNGVKIYKLKSGIKALRNTSQEILLSHCTWLSEHGYGSLKDNTYFVDRVDQLLLTGSTRSTPDSTVVVVNSSNNLLTNCCPEVNTVNTSNSGSSSDFVDCVDKIDPLVSEILVTELNNPPSVELCNENSQDYIEVVNTVNTVNNSGEMPKASGVDPVQQLVNKGQHSQQADNADNAIAPMPLEQTNSTSADESEEVSAPASPVLNASEATEVEVETLQTTTAKPAADTRLPKRVSGGTQKTDMAQPEVAQPPNAQFPSVGTWVRVLSEGGKIGRVSKHYGHGVKIEGDGLFGVYNSFEVIDQTERLQLGLT